MLHFLALDEQEMQAYLWQPRFPRIIGLRNQMGNTTAGPPSLPADHLVDPKQLWLRLLTICPPLFSASAPVPAGFGKKPKRKEKPECDSALLAAPTASEPQEYFLNSAGEQFLPILFDDSGGAAECVPPEELLLFEEDALREVASHIESKLTHALTCILLAAKARASSSVSKTKRSRLLGTLTPTGGPAVIEDSEAAEASSNSVGLHGGAKRRRSDDDGPLPTDSAEPLSKSAFTGKPYNITETCGPAGPHVGLPANLETAAECWRSRTPAAIELGTNGGGVVIGLEDLVATYGVTPCLTRHELCFQQESEFWHLAM